MISVKFQPNLEIEEKPKWRTLLRQAVRAALGQGYSESAADVTVLLGDDSYLRELNRQFAGVDAATDVLSFFVGEVNPENGVTYLGDVAISFERAQQQAEQAGHPLEHELRLLAVHGVLHLCGYDHATIEDQSLMWKIQAAVLHELGANVE